MLFIAKDVGRKHCSLQKNSGSPSFFEKTQYNSGLRIPFLFLIRISSPCLLRKQFGELLSISSPNTGGAFLMSCG